MQLFQYFLVDGIGDRFAGEILSDPLGAVHSHSPKRPVAECRIVGRDDHILHGEEGIVISRRLLLKHIQAGPGDLAGLQGLDQDVYKRQRQPRRS